MPLALAVCCLSMGDTLARSKEPMAMFDEEVCGEEKSSNGDKIGSLSIAEEVSQGPKASEVHQVQVASTKCLFWDDQLTPFSGGCDIMKQD